MASIDDLVKAANTKRVQVADLADAPKLQATIQSGGQYSVAVQRAGSNKMLELADALSKVNPILKEYGAIRSAQREEDMITGAQDFASNPGEYANYLKNLKGEQELTSRKIRKLVEQGLLPPEANPARMLGAMQAQSEVMVKRGYRAQLMNPELLNTSTDPEVDILSARQEFLKRDEFASTLVRNHALEHMANAEEEFRRTVNNRITNNEIEKGINNWIELGKDPIQNILNGDLDINDQSVKDWINHPAGMFKGSRKHAWNNLIREELLEGLTTTVENPDGSQSTKYQPSQVLDFLEDLRELNLGGGAKFADAETGLGISAFVRDVENMAVTVENKNNKAVNTHVLAVEGGATEALYNEALKMGGKVSRERLNDILVPALARIPPHKKAAFAKSLMSSFKSINGLEERDKELESLIGGELLDEINEGKNLTASARRVKAARDAREISYSRAKELLTAIDKSRNFSNMFLKTDSYRSVDSTYEVAITGFKQESDSDWEGEVIGKSGFFNDMKESSDMNSQSLYDGISTHGETFAKIFVGDQHRVFERRLNDKLKKRFQEIEQDEEKTPNDAVNAVTLELNDIAASVYEDWQIDTVKLANEKYNLNFPIPTFDN